MDTELDWSPYDSYGAGDAYAGIPTEGGGFGKAAAVCIGNRQCQTLGKGVMCPSFRVTRDEAHSTWHRAATLKAALNGEYGEVPFIGPELKAAMDLCVGCKGCKRECPNGVDMALLRIEALAQRWRKLGKVPLRERLFANLPRLAPWLQHLDWALKLREEWPFLAGALEKTLGVAADRSLPRVRHKSFLSGLSENGLGPVDGGEVVLLVDTFSNHFEPAIANAALKVLLAGGYRVHVAGAAAGERPLCCGRTYLSHGLIREARAEAARLVAALTPFAERQLPIIGLEPSCLLMLRDEYHALVPGGATPGIAKSAVLLEEFLAKESDGKRLELPLKPFSGRQVAVHGHCHQKAFGAMKSMRKVLGLIPELEVEWIESSCCGMAGSFGLEAEHAKVSMQMAELSLLPAIRTAGENTPLVANGTSCRQQIRDGVKRQSQHVAELLAEALE